MNLSIQQQAIVDWTKNGKGSAFVEAVAGAGKTTTLLELLSATKGPVAFAAYNKAIATEIKEKVAKLGLGPRVNVGTFHSFGFNAWRKIHPDVKVDAREKEKRTTEFLRQSNAANLDGFVRKLASLAKQRALGVFGSTADLSKWFEIVDHFDLAFEIEDEAQIERGVNLAIRVLELHVQWADKLIDFDDMIYMPLVSGCKMWENDWVLVDEAQDTNPARRALARKMLRQGGRGVFVGDRHQSIYGFSGADSNAIDLIVKDFSCKILPMTTTYRCPKAVVSAAQAFVSHIVAADSAPEGVVRTIHANDLPTESLTAADAVLCRNTKPLVEMAYTLIRKGVACHVEGRDIGAGLLKLVDRFKANSLPNLIGKLEDFAERESEKLIAKGKETQAEALLDKIETIRTIAAGSSDIFQLKSKIQNLFLDAEFEAKPTLTLSTVHRSKGREWNRVFLLGHDTLMPSRYARQEWQKQQENNLIYVAYTRSKSELILVDLPASPKG